jgi:hypothetical protein
MKSVVLSILSVASAVAQAVPYRSIQRIWAVEPEKIEAARVEYPCAFSDGIIIATFAGLKIGPIDREKSYNIRSTAQEMKKAMTTGKALNGKPYAGNPHVRFDEG